jgi:hypothetical protein
MSRKSWIRWPTWSVARGITDGVDLVYVNDNYGDLAAQFSDIVRSALDGARPDLIKPILPDQISGSAACLTKVRHSAFYATALAYLLGLLTYELGGARSSPRH